MKIDKFSFRYDLPQPPDGTLTPTTAEEVEAQLVRELEKAGSDRAPAFWNPAEFYKLSQRPEEAQAPYVMRLDKVEEPEACAAVLLSLGESAEKTGDFALAASIYQDGLDLEPQDELIRYFLHNNMGDTLDHLGRRAIEIRPVLSDAHKNLGRALQGQGRCREAAQAFVDATRADASDPRSLEHLEDLLRDHPELAVELAEDLANCRQAVAFARDQVHEVPRPHPRMPAAEED